MSIILIRSILLYGLVIFAVRMMGKRQIGELQPSELVVTILISNIATLPIEEPSVPMLTGIVPILVLVSLDVLMSGATLRWRKLRRVVSGSPKVVIRDGVIDQKQLKELRYSLDDLMESLHGYSIFDVSQVQFAVIETTGQLTVYQKYAYQNLTPEMVSLKNSDLNPPAVIISDGVFLEDALASIDHGRGWVDSILKEQGLQYYQVFLFTADKDGKWHLVPKEGVKGQITLKKGEELSGKRNNPGVPGIEVKKRGGE